MPLVAARERVAIVGNRKGADLQHVVQFIDALHAQQPGTIVISGGAEGVDQLAESTWFRLGGRIRSYRPVPWDEGYGVEVWNYGGPASASVLPPEVQGVQLADYKSAALYRDMLIGEDCDRLVAFYRAGMTQFTGTAFTQEWAQEHGALIYTMRAATLGGND